MSFAKFSEASASTVKREVILEYFAGSVRGDSVECGKIFQLSDKETKKDTGGCSFNVTINSTTQNEDSTDDGAISEKFGLPRAGYYVGRMLNAFGVDPKQMKDIEKAGMAFEKANTAAAKTNSPADNKKATAAAEKLVEVLNATDVTGKTCFVEHYPKSTRTGTGGGYSSTDAYDQVGWDALKEIRGGQPVPGKNYLAPVAIPDGLSAGATAAAVVDVEIDLDDDDDDE